MVSSETQSILQRKAANGTKEHEVRSMSVAKAMRLSIAKIGNDIFEMPLSVIGAVTEFKPKADLKDLISEDNLLCLLEGQGKRVGAALIAPDVVGGIIQQQTMSFVSEAKSEARKMTATDAAMCAPLLDNIFKYSQAMIEETKESSIATGYSYGAKFDDSRALDIALEAQEYYIVRLTLDLAAGKRQGDLIFFLPNTEPEEEFEISDGNEEGETVIKPKVTTDMTEVTMGLKAEMNIVLCHLQYELAQAQKFKCGDVIKLPLDAFPEAEIYTSAGKAVGTGVLGQVDGIRALRLKRDPVHAKQPRRRESDLPNLDLPEIKAIPGVTEREVSEFTEDMGLISKPQPNENKQNTQLQIPNAEEKRADFIELPELEDLPDLADMPDLADLPDLATNS